MSKLENLNNYKYNCVDKSILTKYILNPIHDKIALLFPTHVAPNMITMLGLLCSVTSTIITLITDPQLNNQKYPAVKLINAVLLFCYQAFDAIDGKQARRIGMSTPLGQLFDHGCDAFVCFCTSITLTSSFGLGRGTNLYYITICMALIYALCSYEEYFTDLFYLGYINGPSEGIILGVVSHIVSYYNESIFKNMLSREYRSMPVLLIFCIVFSAISIANSFIFVILNRKKHSKAEIWDSFMRLITLFIAAFTYQFHPNSDKNFYMLYFTFMFVFAKLTLGISYSHLKAERIQAFDMFYYIYIMGAMFGIVFEMNRSAYGIMAFIMFVNYCEFAYMTMREICGFLQISCFQVKAKETKKNK